MRIGTKLLMGFIPLAILTAMVAEVLYINSKWISDSSQLVKDIYQNYANILEIRKHEKNYFFYREKFYLLRIRDLSGRLSEFYSSRIQAKDLDEMGRGVQSSREVLNRYQGLIDQILLPGEPAQIEQTLSELGALGQQLEHLGEQLIHIAWIPIQVGTRKARTYSTVFAIQAALIGAVLAFYLSQLLVKPIQQLVQGTKKVSEGDFSQRVVLRSRDEIGELAQSFNRMVVSLEQSQTRLNQSSQELRGTKETLENIIQSSVDAIVATDPKGRITFANRSMQEMILGEAGAEGNLLGVKMSQLYSGGLPGSQENHEHHPGPGKAGELRNHDLLERPGPADSHLRLPSEGRKRRRRRHPGSDQRPDGKEETRRGVKKGPVRTRAERQAGRDRHGWPPGSPTSSMTP